MLHEFLSAHRDELIGRCRLKMAQRRTPQASDAELEHGVALFLDQLVKTLRAGSGAAPVASQMGAVAARHGLELLQHGFTVDEVVHDYGDLCQAITDLAVEREVSVEVDEFRTLNRCLDNAIADSVAEFSYQRDLLREDTGRQALNERLGFFAQELRALIQSATLALAAIKAGDVGLAGATGGILDRSLVGLRNLVDRSLADVRVTAGMPPRRRPLLLARFTAEVKLSAALEAQARGCTLAVGVVDPRLAVEADRELLFSALGNLLQNAFKFTEQGSEVSLSVHAAGERVLIDVEDACGGLRAGEMEAMFRPLAPGGIERSRLGLGLSICRRSVEANQGVLRVRNVPGAGCVFTIDLPRYSAPPLAAGARG